MRPSAPHASPRPALSVSPAWPCGLGEGAFLSCPSSIAGPPGPPVGVCAPSPRFLPAVCSVKALVLGALQREPIPRSTPVPGAQVPPGVWHTPAPVLTQVRAPGRGGGSLALRVCGALVVHLALTTAPRRGYFRAWLPPLLARSMWAAPRGPQLLRAGQTVLPSLRQELYYSYHMGLVRSSPQVQLSPGLLALAHRWAAWGLSARLLYQSSWASPSVPLMPGELGRALRLRRTWGHTSLPHLGSHGLAVASVELWSPPSPPGSELSAGAWPAGGR